MAVAGRILLIPRGEFSTAETYKPLDIVFYNATSWLCKKTATGVTPSNTTSEYWQPFGMIGLSNNLTTTEQGFALDARQGKNLNNSMIELQNSNVVLTAQITNLAATVNSLMGTNIAEEYDSTATYEVGEYAVYNSDLYKCTTAITVPEVFNNSHWTHCYIMDEIDSKIDDVVEQIVETTLGRYNTYTVTTEGWVASGDTNCPFKCEFTSSDYSATSTPIWDLKGAATNMTAEEKTAADLIASAYFDATGITLYATAKPASALVLRVKGA